MSVQSVVAMIRIAALFAVALVVSATAAPVPKAIKKPDGAKQLAGQWASVSLDGGKGHQPNTTFWLIVDGDKLWMGTGTPSRDKTEYRFTLDPSQSPKHLNLTSIHGPQEWIYDIDGDTLTWCHPSGASNERPTGMRSDRPYYCTVWKRVTDDKNTK